MQKALTFESSDGQKTYTITQHITCDTIGVIYYATCPCQKIYVGLTSRQLKTRAREHYRDIVNAREVNDISELKPVPRHFKLVHDCNVKLLKICGIDKVFIGARGGNWRKTLAQLEVELIRRDYMANGGWETFLSYEDPEQDILIGLLRLRKCSPESFRPELKGGVSIVRELHVYGSVVPVSSRDPSKFQHQGFGMLLMEEAERIARDEHGSFKIAVISGECLATCSINYSEFFIVEVPGSKMSSNDLCLYVIVLLHDPCSPEIQLMDSRLDIFH
ncbi:unnamed protein product [Ranitomeya imitator]|uniref:N-acetyltransferase domain-containing protein n=1 Tax=Ranitomeya imitator TaxID=111125 RepID=A0ABN9M559_9NEOB|nr:unnamed protein product [Ranitomeya imitator]